ncbi:MAG: DUF305 domain-containing protein [Leptolyngbyaceae cyanobacterium bins.349]|nr:DUF305 domain-containing protein [Leptolyngbyaceae cyanobacterium bins.349]
MKRINLKAGFLEVVLVAIAASVTACATDAQTQTQASGSTVAQTESKPSMHHGGMDHSMMELGPADAEFDLRFIDSMIPHHEGAVTMAQAVLQKSQRPELRTLAQSIIKAQKQEIAQMQGWRKAWYPQAPSQPVAWHAAMGHSMTMFPEQIKALRMDVDLGAADAEFDQRFIAAMIPHHEGAVVMAKDVLQKSQRSEVLQMAKAIISSQQAEIEQMQQWRKAWYGK